MDRVKYKYVVNTHIKADQLSDGKRLAQLPVLVIVYINQQILPFVFTPLTDHQERDLGNANIILPCCGPKEPLHKAGNTNISLVQVFGNGSGGFDPLLQQ